MERCSGGQCVYQSYRSLQCTAASIRDTGGRTINPSLGWVSSRSSSTILVVQCSVVQCSAVQCSAVQLGPARQARAYTDRLLADGRGRGW
jgi:hypothetical protein